MYLSDSTTLKMNSTNLKIQIEKKRLSCSICGIFHPSHIQSASSVFEVQTMQQTNLTENPEAIVDLL